MTIHDDESSASGYSSSEDLESDTQESGGTHSASMSGSPPNDRLYQKETTLVVYLRALVFLVLVGASVALCSLVFDITRKSDSDEFVAQYMGAAEKISEAFLSIAEDSIGAAGSLVVATIAHSIDHFKDWPFVTLSSFQRRAKTVKLQSDALYIGINPIVKLEDRAAWENYTTYEPEAQWYPMSVQYQEEVGIMNLDNRPQVLTDDPNLNLSTGVANHIYSLERKVGAKATISIDKEFYLPVWQTSPVTRRSMVNQDRASNSVGALYCIEQEAVVIEGMQSSTPGFGSDSDPLTAEIAWLLRLANGEPTKYLGDIFSTVYLPLYDGFDDKTRKVVGVMRLVIHWARYFANKLPPSLKGIVVVLENSCDEPYTFQIDGEHVIPLGHGDLHDPKWDKYRRSVDFSEVGNIADGTPEGMRLYQDSCPYQLQIYPSQVLYDDFATDTPKRITIFVALLGIFTMIMFFVYDRLVERRQGLILRKAEQTNAIVSSLFPENVRDRMMAASSNNKNGTSKQMFTDDFHENDVKNNSAPIADLFPNSTVMFSDISGFTAWSSSRDPAQVFTLLQNVYQSFDKIAQRRSVFKVETIGDSYVAVAGLPRPQEHHATIMARFASDCMLKFLEVTRELETTLGPGTGELAMRFGLHSGPVTAGVLMGERSRFQLFGDTVNVAARMESTGTINKIQGSQATADILVAAGKGHWVTPRNDVVEAKGKGVMNTFWINARATTSKQRTVSNASSDTASVDPTRKELSTLEAIQKAGREERKISWMSEVLQGHIKQIVSKRDGTSPSTPLSSIQNPSVPNQIPLDEVAAILDLPTLDANMVSSEVTSKAVAIPEKVIQLIDEFVLTIASMYRDNPFHNFDHACHVTMSTIKFLKRVVSSEAEHAQQSNQNEKSHNTESSACQLREYTHGVNNDAIALFGIVFSALIHDVDHRGVSNAQLMKEDTAVATRFRGKSVAEQNSIEVAWKLLMSQKFKPMREYIFVTSEELDHFRQVLVNVVLATDIFDKELGALRRSRWNEAFTDTGALSCSEKNGLQATIVIEHIIQAADVSHTMQHWHIYRQWNKNLFEELLLAYQAGRMGSDPATFWYKGELDFFDNYVIPLAKKLKNCKVFGVSSDECLNYAEKNRAEWESRGKQIVEEMIVGFMNTNKA